jgi:hypothetical protein
MERRIASFGPPEGVLAYFGQSALDPRDDGSAWSNQFFRPLHKNFRPSPWTIRAVRFKITYMISSHSAEGNRNQFHHRGDFMNGSRNIRSCKRLAWIAVLSGAMVTAFSLSAFGQQEVDPTWFDPWAAPTAAAVHPAQKAAVQHHARLKTVSSSKRAAKTSVKRTSNPSKPS